MMMRMGIGVLVLMVVLAPLSADQPATTPVGKDKPSLAAEASAAAKDVAADLREARDLLKKVTDKQTRERLELLLTRSELRIGDIQKNLAGLAAAAKPVAISTEDFSKLIKGLQAEAFDDGKASFVANFSKGRHFTCAQAREMLKLFSFDAGRGQAAVALYPLLTDPENFFTALEVFTFDSGRKAVREKLKLK